MPTPSGPDQSRPPRPELIEGLDYYIESIHGEDCLVFTAHFLLNRGWCCNNACRHCPYTPKPPFPTENAPTD